MTWQPVKVNLMIVCIQSNRHVMYAVCALNYNIVMYVSTHIRIGQYKLLRCYDLS